MFFKRLVKLITCLLLALFFSHIVPHAYAASNFSTDYHVIYTIDEQGMTHAVIKASLINTSSQFYASSYKMQIGFDSLTNVKVTDSGGEIVPVITKNDEGYAINISFNNKVVGLGNKQDFTLTFDTPKLARRYGKIWEIDIPGIANPDDFSNFIIELKVPNSFGEPAYIKPRQSNKSLIFTKDMLGKAGISIAFGTKQMFTYALTYHLRNTNLYPVTTEIALPPSTNYQDVYISSMDPKPANVTVDKDGNWIAQYHLTSAQKLDVLVKGNTEIKLIPKSIVLTTEEKKQYTSEEKYWETSNDKIRELADELKTPAAIYTYVINTLKYDFKRVTDDKPRLGAVGALNNPNSAVCREYTDLFIALARAAGIPAREVDGYAYTENTKQRPLSLEKDILHVWPEYYDTEKGTWVMVDPTWGSTTGGVDYFDMNDFAHFAFVIKGVDSEFPLPAGAYKFTNDKVTKDVQVSFSTMDTQPINSVQTNTTIPTLVIAGLPITGSVIVKNTGNTYIEPQIVYLTSHTLLPGNQTIATTGLPPYGSTSVVAKFQPTSFLTNIKGDYTIRVAGVTQAYEVTSAPFYMTPAGGGITIGLFAIIILTIAIKSGRLRLSRRK